MADFYQNGIITTLHNLDDRPIEEVEAQLNEFANKRPMALILLSLQRITRRGITSYHKGTDASALFKSNRYRS